ncbi:MAG TPA: hypothetical protein VER39_16985 [Nocardioidaceae bacterium]|nr:hypothetical protein [Nocardioidaceae bacterium]
MSDLLVSDIDYLSGVHTMMKRLCLLLATSATAALGLAAPAHAATATNPCGSLSLWATHAASADFYDRNGDRLECRPRVAGPGRDNYKLPLNNGYKFYAFDGDKRTGVTYVNKRDNYFWAWTVGQEDDRDWVGCWGRCRHKLFYDANDLLFLDTGNGSRRVSSRTFENNLAGADNFSVIYTRGRAAVNVFSLVK